MLGMRPYEASAMKPLAALLCFLTALLAGAAIGWIERDKVEPEQVATWIVDPETGHSEMECR